MSHSEEEVRKVVVRAGPGRSCSHIAYGDADVVVSYGPSIKTAFQFCGEESFTLEEAQQLFLMLQAAAIMVDCGAELDCFHVEGAIRVGATTIPLKSKKEMARLARVVEIAVDEYQMMAYLEASYEDETAGDRLEIDTAAP